MTDKAKIYRRQKSTEASYFEKMREIDDLMSKISAGLETRSMEQMLNGGDNLTSWPDVGDIAGYIVTLRDLNDRVNREGEYA